MKKKKENKNGTQKGQQLPFPFRSSIPEVSIHTRHTVNATLLPSSSLRIVCRHRRSICHQIKSMHRGCIAKNIFVLYIRQVNSTLFFFLVYSRLAPRKF